MKLRVGSRESVLAVWQAKNVMEAIHTYDDTIELELVTMKTTGDKILDRTLDKVGGKGLFVKELDAALLDGRADITVHSSKDLPMELNPALPLVAFSKRADPRDVLVLRAGTTELDPTKPIGCASKRREIQLRKLYPDMDIQPVRGNVQTRLRKLDEGQYSALILAAAGLKRLGLEDRISRYFEPSELLPSAGQGILAVQARANVDTSCLDGFRDADATDCIRAERAFVKELDGGCSSPVAAYATVDGDTMTLTGMDAAGNRLSCTGPRSEAEKMGTELARKSKEANA